MLTDHAHYPGTQTQPIVT